MSYEPTNWKDGDLVTSAKLNKLEQGVANGANFEVINMEVAQDRGHFSLDKTAGEIIDILKSGKYILVISIPELPSGTSSEVYQYFSTIPMAVTYVPDYGFQILLDFPTFAPVGNNGLLILTASSLDQYPSYNI